jgi:hypothetical protein
MMRITMLRLAPVLAILTAVASAGCLEQTTTDTSGTTDEGDVVSERAGEVPSADSSEGNAVLPSEQVQLKLTIQSGNEDDDTPVPSEKLNLGPRPEPWNGSPSSVSEPKQAPGLVTATVGARKP